MCEHSQSSVRPLRVAQGADQRAGRGSRSTGRGDRWRTRAPGGRRARVHPGRRAVVEVPSSVVGDLDDGVETVERRGVHSTRRLLAGPVGDDEEQAHAVDVVAQLAADADRPGCRAGGARPSSAVGTNVAERALVHGVHAPRAAHLDQQPGAHVRRRGQHLLVAQRRRGRALVAVSHG